MAKSEVAAQKKSSKKSKAILVFDIIFIVLAVLLVVSALLVFTPRNKVLYSLPQSWISPLYDWVEWHALRPFGRGRRIGPSGVASKGFTVAFFLFIMAFCVVFLFYLLYQPFVLLANNKAKGKNQVYRKVVCWLTFVILFVCIFGLRSLVFQYRFEKWFGSAYSWWPDFFNKVAKSFVSGQLSVIAITFISRNGAFNALAWATIILVAFEIIRLAIAGAGKGKAAVAAKEETAPIREKTEEKAIPVATVAVRAKEKDSEPQRVLGATKVDACLRDLQLLASLEPIHVSR